MNSNKQKHFIELMVSSADTFALCQNIISAKFFDPEYRNTITFIKHYYSEYDTTPSVKAVEAETNLKLDTYDVAPDEARYVAVEIEKFCKAEAVRAAVLECPDLINKRKFAEAANGVVKASEMSLTKNLGLNYFEDVDDRIARMLKDDPTTPTGWADLDAALFGGISRKELLLVAANSGGGKSIVLANLAFNYINKGMNVLFISLELSEDVVAQRFDTMFTGYGRKSWKDNSDKIIEKISSVKKKMGRMDITQMPTGTTSNHIRAYLKDFYLQHGITPDLLILDYLDNMAPNEHVSADNIFEKDKRSAEQLRQIGIDYNMFVATASQLNRGAIGATEFNHSQIAGGISKINVCDVYLSIIMTDEMRAAGKMIFNVLKTRNSDGVGKQIFLKWDGNRLRVTDEDTTGSGLIFNKRELKNDNPTIEEDGDLLSDTLKTIL